MKQRITLKQVQAKADKLAQLSGETIRLTRLDCNPSWIKFEMKMGPHAWYTQWVLYGNPINVWPKTTRELSTFLDTCIAEYEGKQ